MLAQAGGGGAGASTTYCVHRELSKPTVVDYAARARFTSPHVVNLVLARSTMLEVYELRDDDHERGPKVAAVLQATDPSRLHKPMLRHRREFPMFGVIEDLKVVRLKGRTTDSLVLAFGESRISVVHFDPSTERMVTLSMYSFDSLKQSIAVEFTRHLRPLTRVDPENRCVAMVSYDTQLWIFPTLSASASSSSSLSSSSRAAAGVDIESNGSGDAAPSASTSPLASTSSILSPALGQPMSISLSSLGTQGVRIKDAVFLAGSVDPVLLLLTENAFTWTGRYAVARNTCALVLVALNLVDHRHSVIARVAELPHDSMSLLALPSPLSGALLFSASAVFHFTNKFVDFALAVNEHADPSGAQHMTKMHSLGGLGVSLAHSHASIIGITELSASSSTSSSSPVEGGPTGTALRLFDDQLSGGSALHQQQRHQVDVLVCLDDYRVLLLTLTMQGLAVLNMTVCSISHVRSVCYAMLWHAHRED